MRTAVSQFEQYIKLNRKIPPEVLVSINQIDEPGKLADTVASHLNLKIPEKQELLEIAPIGARLEKIYSYMEGEIGVMQVEKRIRTRVKRQMEKTQREYYLNEQMKAIQKELGEGEDGRDEAAEFEARIKATKLTKEAREKSLAEVKKLRESHKSTMSTLRKKGAGIRTQLREQMGTEESSAEQVGELVKEGRDVRQQIRKARRAARQARGARFRPRAIPASSGHGSAGFGAGLWSPPWPQRAESTTPRMAPTSASAASASRRSARSSATCSTGSPAATT
jgi:hypothetical protein